MWLLSKSLGFSEEVVCPLLQSSNSLRSLMVTAALVLSCFEGQTRNPGRSANKKKNCDC